MDKFITLPDQDRRDAFQETATRRGVLPIIIEKDFWVCWTLKKLYSLPEFSNYITFKGGTSLSKAYGLIDRFSEDIDLTISKNMPNLMAAKNPIEKDISSKERNRRIVALKLDTQNFVLNNLLPAIKKELLKDLKENNEWSVVLDISDKDKQTILFNYPRTLDYHSNLITEDGDNIVTEGGIQIIVGGYIKPSIKLEFGARGDTTPAASKKIMPYIAEEFPDLFGNTTCSIPTLAVERTFWEKATILHALYHGSKMRDRTSRHYYDTIYAYYSWRG